MFEMDTAGENTTKISGVYNVIVIGIPGAGKSELVNYIWNKKVAKTGVGLPVTKRGFKKYELDLGGLPFNLYDSWGMEIGKLSEWTALLDEELEAHGVDKPVEEWIHTVLYCINAGGKRIQPSEIGIIRRLQKANYDVIIVLTQVDLIDEEAEAEQVENILKALEGTVPVVPVCSVLKKRRGAPPIKPFGRGELIMAITNRFWDSILARLPARCSALVKEHLDKCLRLDGLTNEKIVLIVQEEIMTTFGLYQKIMAKLGSLQLIDDKISIPEIVTKKMQIINEQISGFYVKSHCVLLIPEASLFVWASWLVLAIAEKAALNGKLSDIRRQLSTVEAKVKAFLEHARREQEEITKSS
eukprot:TRINITY_DN8889_c0_g1_i1.p1 TRINITY_DN8889_c0_g1~~TRINITY_DN8889_c0_g1_i1.p1  ORF type:complete len:356 (+),score=70.73 TRINITY_DN8889_c0_g1_i1:98-1165(+)